MTTEPTEGFLVTGRISRRNVLTAAGVAAAGAAVSMLPVSAASAGSAEDATTNRALRPSSSGPRAVSVTPGVSYVSTAGQDFKPTNSTSGWQYVGGNGLQLTGAAGQVGTRLNVPQGALITECAFWVTYNDTNGMSALLAPSKNDSSTFQTVLGTPTIAQSPSPQQVDVAIPTPVPVDNSLYSYDLRVTFGTAGSTQLLHGARIGYTNNPGLVTFPDPRRIVHGDATPYSNGVTYGPINALQKWDGSGPTGVPAGAKAAFCAVQSYTPGVLTLFPDGATDPGSANYSGTGNLGASLNMVYMLVPLSSAGKFKIHAYFTGKVYVDAWGYLI